MKKIFNTIMAIAISALALTGCEDIPAPYEIPTHGSVEESSIYYNSVGLNTGWTTYSVTSHNAWSQGSNYTQATGYQDWENTGSKSNREVKSYLISPAFRTTAASGKVKIYFDQTIRYTNNVSDWASNHKVYVSKNYNGDYDSATWEELPYTPTASPYNDWTLYSSGEIQLPDAYVNADNVCVSFYFYAPASASTTWELKNFTIEEGIAEEKTPDNPDDPTEATEISCAKAVEICKALDDKAETTETYTVTGYITDTDGKISREQQVFWMADTKDGGKVFEAYWANIPDPTKPLPVGTKVKMTGKLMRYGSTSEMKNGDVVVLEMGDDNGGGGNTGGGDIEPTGDNLLGNGDFEQWEGNTPANWKSASTASNATLAQGTDAHGGSYSVIIKGDTGANKRLAYKELTLDAGTYTFSFYAKATADPSQLRPGFVPVTDGKVGSYAYGEYANITSSWTLVTHTFTLAAKTTVCLVVMNPKKSSYSSGADAYIDDARLVRNP